MDLNFTPFLQQDLVTRPVSVQSNGSMYSDNELWQNEIKNKMELSQIRLTALKQQQKRLIKYQVRIIIFIKHFTNLYVGVFYV